MLIRKQVKICTISCLLITTNPDVQLPLLTQRKFTEMLQVNFNRLENTVLPVAMTEKWPIFQLHGSEGVGNVKDVGWIRALTAET